MCGVLMRGYPQQGLKRRERFSMSVASPKGEFHGWDSYPAVKPTWMYSRRPRMSTPGNRCEPLATNRTQPPNKPQ